MTLFTPLRLRGTEFKNRIAVSPMCEYSAEEGHPGTWHLVHLGSRAVGGTALVMGEATAVQAIGRISPSDTGLYLDSQADACCSGATRSRKPTRGVRLSSSSIPKERWLEFNWLTRGEKEARPHPGSAVLRWR